MGFDEMLSQLEQQNARKPNIVEQTKQALAPTRAAAFEALQEFDALADATRPKLAEANEKCIRAAAHGVVHQELADRVRDVLIVLEGGRNNFLSIVAEIDNLDALTIARRWHLGIPERLAARRASNGVAWAMRCVESELLVLEEMMHKRLEPTR